MVGMVTTPTAAAFAGPVPVIVAKSALAKTETLAAEPREVPIRARARSMKKSPPPMRIITAPNSTKT
jgi:hypothetical protein